jgi:hypothetical protein
VPRASEKLLGARRLALKHLPHYYRLHGPRLVIEYDNTRDGANHVHAVWHDPTNSFGQDLLRAHYESSHNKGQ